MDKIALSLLAALLRSQVYPHSRGRGERWRDSAIIAGAPSHEDTIEADDHKAELKLGWFWVQASFYGVIYILDLVVE
jgi:hypothetical protein